MGLLQLRKARRGALLHPEKIGRGRNPRGVELIKRFIRHYSTVSIVFTSTSPSVLLSTKSTDPDAGGGGSGSDGGGGGGGGGGATAEPTLMTNVEEPLNLEAVPSARTFTE